MLGYARMLEFKGSEPFVQVHTSFVVRDGDICATKRWRLKNERIDKEIIIHIASKKRA